jgi:putative flippase GtrA
VWFEMNKKMAQIMKFGMVGAVNTGIDFTIFTLLTLWGWSYMPAQCVSYTSGVMNSYVMNRSWTFKGSGPSNRSGFVKFLVLNLLLLLITSSLIAIMHQDFGWPVMISKLCASGAGVFLNYAGSRYWVFGQQRAV